MAYVGKPLRLVDGDVFVRGLGRYLADIKIPGGLYLRVIRSPYPRAAIRSIRVSGRRPVLLITSKDLRASLPLRLDPELEGHARVVPMPVLAEGRANFVGQPVAALVAEDPYEAEDLAEGVEVEYEPLEAVSDPEKAFEPGAPQIHEGVDRNLCIDRRIVGGDVGVFRGSDEIVEAEIVMERVVANPIETRGCLAIHEGGSLILYATAQNPFRVREDLSKVLGIPVERVRVVSPHVGGGFGVKVPLHAEYVVAAHASMVLGRPVKWVETRREHLVSPYHGRGVRARVRGFFSREGRLMGISGSVVVDLGAYNFSISQNIALNIVRWAAGPYAVRAVDIDLKAVFTNKTPFNAYRGAGRPEAAMIHERLLDAAAEELGIDKAEIRRINLLEGRGVHANPLGVRIDVADYRSTFERAAKRYEELRRSMEKICPRGSLCGVGIASYIEYNRVRPGEAARIKIRGGRVEMAVGTHSHGQGHATTYAQLAAEELGIPIEAVRIVYGDTEGLSRGEGTSGSRSLVAGGGAVVRACRDLKEILASKGLSVERALRELDGFEHEVFYQGDDVFSFGAHVAAVSVDPETGLARVIRYIAVDDAGRAVNPAIVEGQIAGGALQGAAQILWEAARYDENAYPLFYTIADTGVPTALEAFDVESVVVENPSGHIHGARGIGEAGAIGAPPAVLSALEEAVGSRIARVPVRPEDLIEMLRRPRRPRSQGPRIS